MFSNNMFLVFIHVRDTIIHKLETKDFHRLKKKKLMMYSIYIFKLLEIFKMREKPSGSVLRIDLTTVGHLHH